jgi:hypothetical protein
MGLNECFSPGSHLSYQRSAKSHQALGVLFDLLQRFCVCTFACAFPSACALRQPLGTRCPFPVPGLVSGLFVAFDPSHFRFGIDTKGSNKFDSRRFAHNTI